MIVETGRDAASYPRSSPAGTETEMRKHFVPKVGQMRIAAMAGIWQGGDDFGLDVRGALAQHDDTASKEQRFFHIVGHQQRGEARPLPQRDELALPGDPRQPVQLAQKLLQRE